MHCCNVYAQNEWVQVMIFPHFQLNKNSEETDCQKHSFKICASLNLTTRSPQDC